MVLSLVFYYSSKHSSDLLPVLCHNLFMGVNIPLKRGFEASLLFFILKNKVERRNISAELKGLLVENISILIKR